MLSCVSCIYFQKRSCRELQVFLGLLSCHTKITSDHKWSKGDKNWKQKHFWPFYLILSTFISFRLVSNCQTWERWDLGCLTSAANLFWEISLQFQKLISKDGIWVNLYFEKQKVLVSNIAKSKKVNDIFPFKYQVSNICENWIKIIWKLCPRTSPVKVYWYYV